jgi:predicted transposase/invertase (TIGR01784 family)
MSYDNLCKTLIESDPKPFLRWLLGETFSETTESVQVLKTELSVEPIRADFVSFLQVGLQILHIEFQTVGDRDMPLRMLDYYVRLYRLHRCPIQQIVIFLQETNSPLVRLDRFETNSTFHSYRAVRLWEEESTLMLNDATLLPFAVLARSPQPEEMLKTIAQKIEQIELSKERANIATYAYMLGGLRYSKEILSQLLREEIMRESVTYQALISESEKRGLQQGVKQGLQQGVKQGELDLALRQLRRKFGELPDRLVKKIKALSLKRLEAFGEALLDFQSLEDVTAWLGKKSEPKANS